MLPRGKRDKQMEKETRNALRSFFGNFSILAGKARSPGLPRGEKFCIKEISAPPLPPRLPTPPPSGGVEKWGRGAPPPPRQRFKAQQQTIEDAGKAALQQQQERIAQLEAEVRAQKKLKGETQAGSQSP